MWDRMGLGRRGDGDGGGRKIKGWNGKKGSGKYQRMGKTGKEGGEITQKGEGTVGL